MVRSHRRRLPKRALIDTARPDFHTGNLGYLLRREITHRREQGQTEPGRIVR
jgi:hypothetical protein